MAPPAAPGLLLEVRPMTGGDFYWRTLNPTAIPRMGDIIALRGGYGVVSCVTWEPTPNEADYGVRVVVEFRVEHVS